MAIPNVFSCLFVYLPTGELFKTFETKQLTEYPAKSDTNFFVPFNFGIHPLRMFISTKVQRVRPNMTPPRFYANHSSTISTQHFAIKLNLR